MGGHLRSYAGEWRRAIVTCTYTCSMYREFSILLLCIHVWAKKTRPCGSCKKTDLPLCCQAEILRIGAHILAGTKHNNMHEGLDAALPVYVPEEVLQANPTFKDTLNLLATRKIKSNGVSLTQHQKYEQVSIGAYPMLYWLLQRQNCNLTKNANGISSNSLYSRWLKTSFKQIHPSKRLIQRYGNWFYHYLKVLLSDLWGIGSLACCGGNTTRSLSSLERRASTAWRPIFHFFVWPHRRGIQGHSAWFKHTYKGILCNLRNCNNSSPQFRMCQESARSSCMI